MIDKIINFFENNYGDGKSNSWRKLDDEFINFSKRFFLGDYQNENLDSVLNKNFYYKDFVEYIKSLDDYQGRHGFIKKRWFSKLKKDRVFFPLIDFDHGKISKHFQNVNSNEKVLEIFKTYNTVFLYFLVEQISGERISYLQREIAFLSYINDKNILEMDYSKVHFEFNNFWFENFYEDAVLRNCVQVCSGKHLNTLRDVLCSCFIESSGIVRYDILIDKYGIQYLPLERLNEIIISINFAKDTNYFNEYSTLFKYTPTDNQIRISILEINKIVTLEKPLKVFKESYKILEKAEESCFDLENENHRIMELFFINMAKLLCTNNFLYFLNLAELSNKSAYFLLFKLYDIYKVTKNICTTSSQSSAIAREQLKIFEQHEAEFDRDNWPKFFNGYLLYKDTLASFGYLVYILHQTGEGINYSENVISRSKIAAHKKINELENVQNVKLYKLREALDELKPKIVNLLKDLNN